jgi:hypothetical protein
MRLNLYHNESRTCFKLVNLDAEDNSTQSNRHLDDLTLTPEQNPNLTYWKNDSVSEANPHKYNRVRVLYTHEGRRYTQSYFCINDIILIEGLTSKSKIS